MWLRVHRSYRRFLLVACLALVNVCRVCDRYWVIRTTSTQQHTDTSGVYSYRCCGPSNHGLQRFAEQLLPDIRATQPVSARGDAPLADRRRLGSPASRGGRRRLVSPGIGGVAALYSKCCHWRRFNQNSNVVCGVIRVSRGDCLNIIGLYTFISTSSIGCKHPLLELNFSRRL